MTDKPQELTLALLKEAMEKGTLDLSIERGPAVLISAEERPKVKEALETPEVVEPEKRKLTPEKQAELLSALEDRFAKQPEHYKRPEGVNFAEVRKALEANPALMYSLVQMENTGGAPDIIAVKPDTFIFGDCSAESPNRRDFTYDQAVEMAKEFGVEIMTEEVYLAIQELGKFDINTWSWLATSANIRESGEALYGRCLSNGVFVVPFHAVNHYPDRGWRGVLRVPRI